MRADARERGVGVERGGLRGEAVAVHPVVGVHARDERPATRREPFVQSRDEPARRRRDDAEARVAAREALGDRAGRVARAVVHDDALEVGRPLPGDARETGGQGGRRVARGQQHRDARRRHASASAAGSKGPASARAPSTR
ncbi:MAG: hypothetical protein MUF70_09975 [Myxococcota bacterium]|nr:hypothetical protein [Myxococcota bacterium]